MSAVTLVKSPHVSVIRWPNLPRELVAIELPDVVVIARLDTGRNMTFRKLPEPEGDEG